MEGLGGIVAVQHPQTWFGGWLASPKVEPVMPLRPRRSRVLEHLPGLDKGLMSSHDVRRNGAMKRWSDYSILQCSISELKFLLVGFGRY